MELHIFSTSPFSNVELQTEMKVVKHYLSLTHLRRTDLREMYSYLFKEMYFMVIRE